MSCLLLILRRTTQQVNSRKSFQFIVRDNDNKMEKEHT